AIRQMAKVQNGGMHIIVEGLARAKSEVVSKANLSLRATVSPLPEVVERSLEIDAYVRRLHELIERTLTLAAGLSQELRGMVAGIDDPLRLAYLLSSLLDIKPEDKQQILEDNTVIADLRKRLTDAKLPEAVGSVAERELERLARMTPASPEYQMTRTYFDWVLDIPWLTVTEDRLDPAAAREVLDADHYDLEKVKERIVEYLAVQKLK